MIKKEKGGYQVVSAKQGRIWVARTKREKKRRNACAR